MTSRHPGDLTAPTSAWRALAKDGADRYRTRAVSGPAPLRIAPGETYDFEVMLPAGDHLLSGESRGDVEIALRVR